MARDKSSGEIVIEKVFPEGAIVRARKTIHGQSAATADALYRNIAQVARMKKAERGQARLFSWFDKRKGLLAIVRLAELTFAGVPVCRVVLPEIAHDVPKR
jgi:hypothetical protein